MLRDLSVCTIFLLFWNFVFEKQSSECTQFIYLEISLLSTPQSSGLNVAIFSSESESSNPCNIVSVKWTISAAAQKLRNYLLIRTFVEVSPTRELLSSKVVWGCVFQELHKPSALGGLFGTNALSIAMAQAIKHFLWLICSRGCHVSMYFLDIKKEQPSKYNSLINLKNHNSRNAPFCNNIYPIKTSFLNRELLYKKDKSLRGVSLSKKLHPLKARTKKNPFKANFFSIIVRYEIRTRRNIKFKFRTRGLMEYEAWTTKWISWQILTNKNKKILKHMAAYKAYRKSILTFTISPYQKKMNKYGTLYTWIRKILKSSNIARQAKKLKCEKFMLIFWFLSTSLRVIPWLCHGFHDNTRCKCIIV